MVRVLKTVIAPSRLRAYTFLGFYLRCAGRFEEAVDTVKTAKPLNPKYPGHRQVTYLGPANFTAEPRNSDNKPPVTDPPRPKCLCWDPPPNLMNVVGLIADNHSGPTAVNRDDMPRPCCLVYAPAQIDGDQ